MNNQIKKYIGEVQKVVKAGISVFVAFGMYHPTSTRMCSPTQKPFKSHCFSWRFHYVAVID